jgi:hypothetical protein
LLALQLLYSACREAAAFRALLLAGVASQFSCCRAENRRPVIMAWLIRTLRVPASESTMGLVLALCIFTLSMMSIALVWQAQVIAKQNVLIHQITSKFGS